LGRYKKKEWSGTKQKILMLHMSGRTQPEIAEKMGVTVGAINKTVHLPKFVAREEGIKNNIRDMVSKRFSEKALWAADKLVKIAEKGSPEDRIRFDALKEILYQVGCKPIEVVETRTRDYTPDEVHSAMLVVKEMEMITNRLTKKKSKFTLEKVGEEVPPINIVEDKPKEDTPSTFPIDIVDTTIPISEIIEPKATEPEEPITTNGDESPKLSSNAG
jgi:hypothetical protein